VETHARLKLCVSPKAMAEHLAILRRVGWVLVVVGLLDIGFMIYSIANQQSYSSSLNIFAVVAGVLLLRGHLGTVRILTWFSAFLFTGLTLCLFAVIPWMQPLDYWLFVVRQDPLGSVVSTMLVVAVLWMLLWVYRELRLPVVSEARAAAGQDSRPPRSAFMAGSALALFLAVVMHLVLNGETANEAKRLAAKQYGDQYSYFVASINWNGGRVSARLTAFREDEAKDVEVEWQQ
jgi:hypothetical protein